MKVLINGIGNIGTTLCNCLVALKDTLDISEIIAYKNRPKPWTEVDLDFLEELGVEVVKHSTDEEKFKLFNSVDYIFDCNANTIGLKNKASIYEKLPNLRGACSQGSEKHFGTPYFYNVNEEVVRSQKFVHIVSCNTHATGYLINSIGTDNIVSTDIVTVRRSEDIGNHTRLVSSNVISRNLDENIGTHHGIDVTDTFKTIGKDIQLQTSDITTPSQLLHSIRFNIHLRNNVDFKKILASDELIGFTSKFDSNYIFELGRRYGFQGRIYNPLIVVENNILYTADKIIGWAFVPQEGNTILSTIASYILQCDLGGFQDRITEAKKLLIRKRW